jgi:hypothetical protein
LHALAVHREIDARAAASSRAELLVATSLRLRMIRPFSG